MSNVAIVTTLPHLNEVFSSEKNIELLSRLMITLPSFMIAILAPFLGHIIYKVGKKRSAIFALLLFSVAGSGGLYLDTIETLLISRAFLGIAIASLMIVSTSLVGDYFDGANRHKFMGLQSAFISIGGMIFVIGGGALSDLGWRYAFSIYLIGFILVPFILNYLVEIPIKNNKQNNTQDIEHKSLFKIYFLAFFLMSVFYILPTQMPFLMINQFNASGTLTGAIISFAFVFNAFGALSFAKLKQKFDYKFIYLLGMFIIGVGFILIGLVKTNVYYFFITAPIMGFGGGILTTCVTAWMLNCAHESKRVKSSGYLTSSLFMGQFFSPILTIPLVSFFGVQDFFIVMGIIVLCFIFIFYFFLRKV
jgi:MFS family permease